MAQIKYIGKKAVQFDRLGDTGLVWDGPGSVVDVEDPAAIARLLAYADIWVQVNDETVTPIDTSAETVAESPKNRQVGAKAPARRKR